MPGNHSLGTIRGTIEIDYDGAGIVRAIKDTDKVKKSHVDLDKSTSRILGTFGRFVGILGKVGASGIVTNGALQGIAATLATLGPLAAAGLAVLPGILASLVAGLVVTKLALLGVGDALKLAGEGGDKFDKALERLSPNARQFVKEYQKAIPVLKKVQQAIQDAFFKGAAREVGGIATQVASLQAQARGVAFAIGKIVQETVRWATSTRGIENVRLILSGLNAFLLRIKGSIGPVIVAFLTLAGQVSQFGGTAGEAVAGGLQKLAEWLETIDIRSLFETALPIVKALGSFLGDVATIAGELFGLFNVDGASAAGVIGSLVSRLADFLQSAQGQEVIRTLGEAMGAIGEAAGPVFLELLKALAPALIALAPAVGTLATQLAGVLVPIIQKLAPLLETTAQFLADNVSWIGPLIGAVVALAAAYKVYVAGAKAVAAIQTILKAQALVSIGNWIKEAAVIVANGAAMVGNAAIRAGTFLASFVASTAAIVAQRVAMLASVVAMGAVRAATIAWTVVQWALNSAFLANPITLTILLIVGLIAIIVKAWKTNETFRKVVMAVWSAIKTAIKAVGDWFVNTLWPSLKKAYEQLIAVSKFLANAVVSYYKFIFTAGKSAFNALLAAVKFVFNAIVSYIRLQINLARTIILTVTNAIKSLWNNFLRGVQVVARAAWNAVVTIVRNAVNTVLSVIRNIIRVRDHVQNAFTAARNAAGNAINSLINLVRGIPGRAANALGNLGGILRAKGASLIQGFINGIVSKINAVRNAANQIVGAVTRFLPGSPAKEGPLSGRGYALLRARRMMADIAKGIDDQAHLPVAAMSGAVTPMVRPLVSAGSTARSAASTPASTPTTPRTFGPYNLVVDGKVISSIVIDTLNGQPKIVAKANTEGTRRSAWAGSGR